MKQIVILAMLIILIGCNKTDDKWSMEDDFTIKLTRSYSNAQSSTPDEGERVNTLRYFVCEKGKVTVISNDLAGSEGTIKIEEKDMTPRSNVYVIANGELSNQMSSIVVGCDETLFTSLETAQSGNNGQIEAIAMSAFASRGNTEIGSAMTLQLQRNMARFDLEIKPNEGIELLNIRVVGLSTTSSLFENSTTNSVHTATYIENFSTPLTESVKGLFYAHPRRVGESAAVVEADVRFNGKLTLLTAPLSEIKRNCIHTIYITKSQIPPTTLLELNNVFTPQMGITCRR